MIDSSVFVQAERGKLALETLAGPEPARDLRSFTRIPGILVREP